MIIDLNERDSFQHRHNGPSNKEIEKMLTVIGVNSIETLIAETLPSSIRSEKKLTLPAAKSEYNYIKDLKKTAQKNTIANSFIGQGYYNTIVPPIIQRNILENPGWYTAYTPYQAEIAQGRLEALINFQTMIIELTGMEIANASLLDEATAAAEAVSMLKQIRSKHKKEANKLIVDKSIFPQTLEVLTTRMNPVNIEIVCLDLSKADLSDPSVFGVYVQYPNNEGRVMDWHLFSEKAKSNDIKIAVGTDLLALTLFIPPGYWGADVVIGTSQRLGVPMGFGGPHAAFFATKEVYKRNIPGRIIGVSKDREGNKAYRMALQTREQHIRREKATSNICTAQVLLAVMASMYAVYHGPKGLKKIALKVHGLAKSLEKGLQKIGIATSQYTFFDTVYFTVTDAKKLRKLAERQNLNFRYHQKNNISISFDETHDQSDLIKVLSVIAQSMEKKVPSVPASFEVILDSSLKRRQPFLEHEVFNDYHSEHEMLRYIKRLENKDLSLVHSMISLGSCTMKLNATTEMLPVTWPEFSQIHPFAPKHQTRGYQILIKELHDWLSEITGFSGISFQPNSGAQGEYTGLMVIRQYHINNGDSQRKVALIPSSAHGTNPASAIMAGMQVIIVKCDSEGNIDLADLEEKVIENSQNLAVLMITYPSTHGVFEQSIVEICALIHKHGGQVYMDGANLNALVGIAKPGNFGPDVCHINLHKTFCIPHGGGGPGMGPIACKKHLEIFLPKHSVIKDCGPATGIGAVSAAPWGSSSILSISWMYIKMMGSEGLKKASQVAILNANYVAYKLKDSFPILYKGKNGNVAHECIIDIRKIKTETGISEEDIAKRLIDFGYHAPTMSWPVAGTMMIEPTESESLSEINRFCSALQKIKQEIDKIQSGDYDKIDNPLKNAPHTHVELSSNKWEHKYEREEAAYPSEILKTVKYWPPVARVDNVYGDKNLFCTCPSMDEYEDSAA